MRGDRTWRRLRLVRRAVQVAALAAFIVLLFGGLQRRDPLPWTDLFFRFDPLTALATMLAAREWLGRLALGLVTIGVTLIVGRVWCGWICPLGTLLGWFRFGTARRARGAPTAAPPRHEVRAPARDRRAWRLFGVLPSSCSIRSRSSRGRPRPRCCRPSTSSSPRRSGIALQWPALDPVVDWVDTTSARQRAADHAAALRAVRSILLVVFLAVVALNAAGRPLLVPLPVPARRPARAHRQGADLAAARRRRLRPLRPLRRLLPSRRDRAAAKARARVTSSECTMCLDCLVALPEHRRGGHRRGRAGAGRGATYDPGPARGDRRGRRRPRGRRPPPVGVRRAEADPRLLRPPGVDDEAEFLSRCLRCSECMKVCPTSGLAAHARTGRASRVLDTRPGPAGSATATTVAPPAARSAPPGRSRRSRSRRSAGR